MIGPKYGYHSNGAKSWLIVKPECLERAKSTFINTNINITTEGCHYPGAAIGNQSFCEKYLTNKVKD